MLDTLRGIVFDLDGTLVDSALDFPAMRRETGCPEGTGLLEFVDSLNCETQRAEAEAVIHRHEIAGAERATWMPGADRLLHSIAASGLPVGIVTRNSREAAGMTLEALGAPAVPLVAREDARPKPDPDGLLQLAERWQLAPSALAYVGDFRFDIEAANRAGMTSVLYLQENNRDYAGDADLVFSHFDELATWLPPLAR
jgi:HAD superfamily hydrolase (TIGR01509 family)